MSNNSFFRGKSQQWWQTWSSQQCPVDVQSKSAETRGKILMAAFDEIYQCGYQAASLNNILKNTGITKGALYHHFKNKLELGYAVVDEVIYSSIKVHWIDPLENTDDPISTIQQILLQTGQQMTQHDIRLGCPLNNLAMEMSPINPGFHEKIKALYDEWQSAIEAACERGKQAGNIVKSADSRQLAILFIATINCFIPRVLDKNACSFVCGCGPSFADTTRTAASAWLVPVIMFFTKSLCPGASIIVK